MSFHNKPNYQIPELIEALKAHRLPLDTPSQLADSFRIGWMACRELAQADTVQEDVARLDFLIDQGAYVVSDQDTCTGYWLHWARPDGSTWVQVDEHPTPRAAIDAARKQGARWQSSVRALTLHI